MIVSFSTPCVFHVSPTHFPNRNILIIIPLPINLSPSSPRSSFRRRALSSGRPPPPPKSEPPNEPDPSSGPTSTTRLQENTRIFFAVLFWMALFFWSSVWDGGNNDGGTGTRPRKGSWFRK